MMSRYLSRPLTRRLGSVCLLASVAVPGIAQELGPPIVIATPIRASRPPIPFDLDLDGDLDLVGSDLDRHELYVAENLSDLGFEIPRGITVDIGHNKVPLSLGVHDFNDDGTQELFVMALDERIQRFELQRYALRAPGVLELEGSQAFPGTAGGGWELVFEDINGDFAADLVFRNRIIGNPGPEFSWVGLREAGSYSFVDISAPYGTDDFVGLVDFDGDGLADQIARTGARELSIVPQTAPGVLGLPNVIDDNAFADRVEAATAADFDGDGRLDALVLQDGVRGIVIYRGLAGGGFGPRRRVLGTADTVQLIVDDADGDGDPDLILMTDTGRIEWARNLGGLQFSEPAALFSAGLLPPVQLLRLVDVNRDGLTDLIGGGDGVDSFSGSAFVAFRTSSSWTGPLVETIVNTRADGLGIVAADVDGDQDLDLVTTPSLAVAENRGPGRFEPPRLPLGTGPILISLEAGDLDGDGLDDLVAMTTSTQIVWFRSLGLGESEEVYLGVTAPTNSTTSAIIDFDSDGDLDVMSTAPSGDRLQVHVQGPPGVFTLATLALDPGGRIWAFHWGDFSGDGRPDVAIRAEIQPGTLGLMWSAQAPDGTLLPPTLLTSDLTIMGAGFLAADLNGSGSLDLAWHAGFGRRIVVSLSVGGALQPPQVVAELTESIRSMVVRPQARGATKDLVVSLEPRAVGEPGRISLVRGLGDGLSFAAPETITEAIEAPNQLVSADLDGDRDHDLAVTGTLAWLNGTERATAGDLYCSEVAANSSGRPGGFDAIGSTAIVDADLQLIASDLPPSSAVLFLASQARGLVLNVGGGAGTLCLGGDVGRFGQPGQIGFTNGDGLRRLTVDLSAIPQPMGAVQAIAGQEWCFQAWHRDSNSDGTPTSNLSDAIAVEFQ